MAIIVEAMIPADWPTVSFIYDEGAGIFPENVASVRVHESCGFRAVGKRERLGTFHGVWRDVLLMERRSRAVGR